MSKKSCFLSCLGGVALSVAIVVALVILWLNRPIDKGSDENMAMGDGQREVPGTVYSAGEGIESLPFVCEESRGGDVVVRGVDFRIPVPASEYGVVQVLRKNGTFYLLERSESEERARRDEFRVRRYSAEKATLGEPEGVIVLKGFEDLRFASVAFTRAFRLSTAMHIRSRKGGRAAQVLLSRWIADDPLFAERLRRDGECYGFGPSGGFELPDDEWAGDTSDQVGLDYHYALLTAAALSRSYVRVDWGDRLRVEQVKRAKWSRGSVCAMPYGE